jgi:ribosome-associated translation inhibitor RaiA
MIDKLDRQVLRHKGKVNDKPHDALKHREGGS